MIRYETDRMGGWGIERMREKREEKVPKWITQKKGEREREEKKKRISPLFLSFSLVQENENENETRRDGGRPAVLLLVLLVLLVSR